MSAKLVPEKIHLIGFRILHAEMNSPIEFNMDYIHSFDNSNLFDLSFNLEEKVIKSEFKVEIKTISEVGTNTEEAFAKFHFAYIFHIENFKDLVTVAEDDAFLDIKGGLTNAIASIVYSTSRGVLMTRFQGTALANFILPVIDPNKLLTN